MECQVCVDSIESIENAIKGGADGIELCSNLFEGGITPSLGMIRMAKKKLEEWKEKENKKVEMRIMIRPRSGDFCYSEEEWNVMKEDLFICKQEGGIDGIVFGILTTEANIDFNRCQQFVKLATPLKVTFHRAFDMVKDPFKSLEDCISLGIDKILTSGLESSCLEGIDMLKLLVEKSQDRIRIVPGGGITHKNVGKILKGSGAKEFHVSGRITLDGTMQFRNNSVFMGGSLRNSEYSKSIVDQSKIEAFKQLLNDDN
eukprot:TRINITY_DN5907_c0_g1_i2.p1 TRINITY_DN5907_c0_g1~~TRINITY_DN5907_c0_g1_i2.p1  ORF type:complete len:258 (+),score=88.32 TRINITY_DN5907_c0_g1_i2:98-871(+)